MLCVRFVQGPSPATGTERVPQPTSVAGDLDGLKEPRLNDASRIEGEAEPDARTHEPHARVITLDASRQH